MTNPILFIDSPDIISIVDYETVDMRYYETEYAQRCVLLTALVGCDKQKIAVLTFFLYLSRIVAVLLHVKQFVARPTHEELQAVSFFGSCTLVTLII